MSASNDDSTQKATLTWGGKTLELVCVHGWG